MVRSQVSRYWIGISAGFFPFINKSNINLEQYGIYSDINDVDLSESCLITAIKQSQQLSSEEIERLKHFIKTRTFLLENLPQICNEFDITFNLRIVSEFGTVSTRKYGNSSRSIPLVVMLGHYMFDTKPNVSFYFINNYEECKNMDTMTVKKQGEYIKTKCSINIETLINKMINQDLLIPMEDEELTTLMINYKPIDSMNYNHQRLINIPDKVFKRYNPTPKPKQSKFYFGYEPEADEIDERLNEIQNLVNSLPLRHHINVRDYYKYSELMNKILYEYGCFDGVFESSGKENQELRAKIHYPRPLSNYNNGKPFEITDKLYYIDMNSSYLSFINGYPTDLTFSKRNFKINELITTLFNLRKQYKQSNPKLATTIKFLMTSCYGYSLRKPKEIKRKYSNNVNNYLANYQNYVFAFYPTKNDNEGFIYSVNNFSTDYNTIQFGADILNNYHKFMDDIRSKVNVIYENIDAVLINESDYNKLNQLGLIGDELGKFKIEHIFTSFKYISPRKWYATCLDGTIEKRGKW